MASFKGVGFPWSKRSTSHSKPATTFPIASALLAVAFSATPFTHRAATAQASADERTIVMCETPSAAVRVYEKEGDVLMRAYSRTQNSLLINDIPTDIQSLAEGTAYQNPQGEIIITVSANDTTEDCTIQVADQPAEPGRILERGAPATLIETVEPEAPDTETPDTEAPDTELPGSEAPGSEAPDMENSETAATAVTGSVLYLPRIALPPGAVVQVKLLDISLADAPAVTVAEQTIVTTGEQVPIPYSLPYADSDINPSATYVVSADILIDDQLSWTTDTQYPVLTQGAPSEVDVVLVMTDSTDTPEPPPVEPTPEPTPEPTEPEPVEPEPTEPEPVEPEHTTPEPVEPEPTEPEPVEPEPTTPEPTEPEPTTPEPTEPEPTTPEPVEPELTEPEPTTPEPTEPEPTEPEAALPNEVEMAVKAALASEISDTATTVESYSPQTWSDGCLGLGGPAEACLAALTEGWQVILVDADTGDRYTYRTNQDGSTVRRDKNAMPISN